MESLSYLHLEAASQEISTQENTDSIWNAEIWEDIFEELEEEEDDTPVD